MVTVTASMELSHPLVSGLSALIVLSTCTAVIPNSLIVIGLLVGEDNVFWKTTSLCIHICACVSSVILSWTSFLYANSVDVLQDRTGCLLVACLQIFAVSEYGFCTFYINLIWTLDIFQPGFASKNVKLLSFGVVVSLVLPPVAIWTSAGVFLRTNQIEVSLNSTNISETCDWSIFPTWFPFGFAYGLIIPTNVCIFVSTVQVLHLAFKKSRIIEAQITAVERNGRGPQNGSTRIVDLARKRFRSVLMGCVNLFLLHAPIVTGTLLMLHCQSSQCSPRYVLNSVWTILFNLAVTLHGTNILIFSNNVKIGIKQFMSKLPCQRQQ